MRIEVVRSGGFAGIPRRATLDTAGHPGAPRLEALARAALATPRAPSPPVPDGFTYVLTIDDRTLHCADPALTPAQRDLITTVLNEGA
ncbi:protealysin inhibitor emfourin [Actinacidiphila sp. bgisy145]|uniref:protealysin inhibitor emfourin n=1 Tax=Actinacidiphila sp. bgisy145 TaxID=3413792 RepID=UPI003EB9C569